MSHTHGTKTPWQRAREIQEIEPSFVFTDDGRDVGYSYTRDGVEHRWRMRRASVLVDSPESLEDWIRITTTLQAVFRRLGGPEYFFRLRQQKRATADAG